MARCLLTLLALLAGLAFGERTTALADRPPSAEEASAILTDFGASSEPSCYDVRVSEVDPAWARVTFARALPDETPDEYLARCNPSDGLTVRHNDSTSWRSVTAGSDFYLCPIKGVPTDVALDLRICRRPERVLIPRGTSYVYRPRTLIQGAHGAYTHLRWHNWGKPSATATGVLEYEDAYTHFRARVRLRASARQQCRTRLVYLRLRVSGVRQHDRRLIGSLAGTNNLECF
jgi:hypothetical protein